MLMHSSLAALLALGASLAVASPINLEVRTPSIPTNIDGSVNHIELDTLIQSSLDKAFAGGKPLSKRAAAAANVALTEEAAGTQDIYYLATASIGTPAQSIPAIVDTGSYDLLVKQYTPAKGKPFNSAASSTFVNTGTQVGGGFVTGGTFVADKTRDTVSVGGLAVAGQYFASTASDDDYSVFGFGFPALSNIHELNWFDSLVAAGKVAANKFSLHLARIGSDAAGGVSELTLGGANKARYTGAATRLPRAKFSFPGQDRWMVSLDSYVSGNGTKINSPTFAIIDSGAPYSYIPRAAATAFFQSIPGSSIFRSSAASVAGSTYTVDMWQFPCSASSEPGYVFTAAPGKTFAINHNDLSLGEIANGMCLGSTFGVDVALAGQQMAILGVDFLKGWYATFDFTDDSISLAAALHWVLAQKA
ncbi:hypothetical protein JCM8097_001794 [Rhodosporidiobolus ruineniae]